MSVMKPSLQQRTLVVEVVIRHLLSGSVGVIPTDTVYGLAARAADKKAVKRLYALKRREHKPGTVIAANVLQLLELGVPPDHMARVQSVWPGPVSVETPLGSDLSYLHQGTGRQGFRVVADADLRSLLLQTGPLLTSSANQPGEPVSTTLKQAWAYFKASVDFYLEGGDLSARLPSTLVALQTDGTVQVIREGAVKEADIHL